MGAFGVGVVGEGGEAVAGGFGEADVAGDDGVEEQVAAVLFELFADFDDEAAAAVVHGTDDTGYVEVGVDGLADFADSGHEVGNAFKGVVFAKHGDDDAVCRRPVRRSPHPIACAPSGTQHPTCELQRI